LSTRRPKATSRITATTVYSARVQPTGALGSGRTGAIAAMMVISGTIERSWNSKIEKARSPCGLLSSFSERSHGNTWAVEDRASGRPIASAALAEKPGAK